MTGNAFTALNSQRLVLEPFIESSICPEYIGWLNDPEVVRFSNQRFTTHTEDSVRQYVRSFSGSSNLFLAIRLAETGRLIGTMTAYVSKPHLTADMGLMIGDRSCWGQGYGLEAWSALMGYLFDSMKLRKVTGGTVSANRGMRLIMERSGMHQEAVRSRQEIIDGVEQDVLYFAHFGNR